MSPASQPPFSPESTLFCSEEHYWEEQEDDDQELTFRCGNNNFNHFKPNPSDLLEHDWFFDEEELVALLSKEQGRINFEDLDPFLAQSRREAVEWMLKVYAFYSFNAVTVVLAVEYFDRFVFSFNFQAEKPWMTQLVSVACLSLAAKMEETQVPLLIDFQIEESKYVFEAKTIQKMEILVLSTLQWRMSPVTPISFLDFIIRRMGLKNHLCWEFLRRCDDVLISLLSEARYMCCPPSVMATATMLHIISNLEPSIVSEYQNQLLGILKIDKDKVDKCCEFIMEMTLRNQSNKRKLGSMPGSPCGVMDVSFSSDSSNDSWSVSSSVCSSPEHLSKKMKTQDQLYLQNLTRSTNADMLDLPH